MKYKIPFSYPEILLSENLAIVGSSGNMINKGMGEKIDSFDEVIRFNRAPVVGFEGDVGSKTTYRVANQHVFGNVPYDRFHQNQDPNFIRKLKDTNIIHLGPNEGYWETRLYHIDPSSRPYKIEYLHIADYARGLFSRKDLNGKNPTVGFLFICLSIRMGIKPNLFGFGIDEGSDITHYWEQRENFSVCHEYNGERFLLRKFQKQGKIIIH